MALEFTDIAAIPHRLVFVYGTLRRGGSNDITLLHPSAEFVREGTITGVLYDLGDYPGVALSCTRGREHKEVLGEIYLICHEAELALDALEQVCEGENGEYVKRMAEVRTSAGHLHCLVYEIHPSRILGRPIVTSGDWLESGSQV